MVLSKEWAAFVAEYKKDGHFQYFPHAHVGRDNFPEIVRILARFEGRKWSDAAVMKALRAAKLTTGMGAGGRMIRRATENLGLCAFEDHRLSITPAGRRYIDGYRRQNLVRQILWRYQLDNPANDGAKGFSVFPHALLIEVLLALDGRITRDEFILFLGRCRDRNDLKETLARIVEWRKLTIAQEDAVIAALGAEFGRRKTDISYVFGFHALASYLDRYSDRRRRKGIRLRNGRYDDAKALLETHLKGAERVDFDGNEARYIASLGDPDRGGDALDALDYYLDTSQYTKAVKIFAKLPVAARGGRTVKEFEESLFLEKDLEDYLVKNLDRIERGLKLVERQRTVGVGTLDILARSAKGEFVVIELKKVRASDKVFGQLCRYMGWIACHDTKPNQAVRGYIIGSEIDDKLRYAARVVAEGVVQLKRFRRSEDKPDIFIED